MYYWHRDDGNWTKMDDYWKETIEKKLGNIEGKSVAWRVWRQLVRHQIG